MSDSYGENAHGLVVSSEIVARRIEDGRATYHDAMVVREMALQIRWLADSRDRWMVACTAMDRKPAEVSR